MRTADDLLRVLAVTAVAGALGCTQNHHRVERTDADVEAVDAAPAEDEETGEDAGSGDEDPPDAGNEAEPSNDLDAGRLDGGAPSVCEPRVLTASRVLPELMIVLDRSQSMTPALAAGVNCVDFDYWTESVNCQLPDPAACNRLACLGVDCSAPPYQGTVVCGGTNASPDVDRWQPAVRGLEQVTEQFQTQLNFGLTLFPGEVGPSGPTTNSGDLCAPGSVRLPSGPDHAAAFADVLGATVPSGATPLADTLNVVLEHLQARPEPRPPTSLLLLTDGQPTCPYSRGNTLDSQALAQDQAMAVEALDALHAAHVKTFVFGFVQPSETALAAALAELAAHGGTEQFYAVQSQQAIVDQFAKLAPELTATCTVQLESAEEVASQLRVTLDDRAVGPDGFVLEGAQLTLRGEPCDLLTAGRPHVLAVVRSPQCRARP